jgi:hypothetical protein
MTFHRTDLGLIAKYLLYPEPLVWIEGHTDIPFYERILRDCSCRLEPAGGKEQCQKLARALVEKDYPYVVVMDGHYDILEKTRSNHRRVVMLHRHSSENYLFEKEPIERVCCNYAKVGSSEELVGNAFEELIEYVESELIELVIVDVAHCRSDTGYQALPNRIEPLLEPRKEIAFSHSEIERRCADCQNRIGQDNMDEAKALVVKFLKAKRLVDLVPGHLVFGIIRRLITKTVKCKTRRKPYIDNAGLMILLSVEVWSLAQSRDHGSLKRRLRRAVREAQTQRQK